MIISVIMTVHNRKDLTLRCLTSLYRQEAPGELKVTLVDDGSTDGTRQAVESAFPQVEVVSGTGALFWAAGMALAEHAALRHSPDVVLWLNDDVELFPDALMRLHTASTASLPHAVVAGTVVDPKKHGPSYGGLHCSAAHPLRCHIIDPIETAISIDTFNGNVVWIPREAMDRIGGIDGRFPHGYADLDFGLRLRTSNYPVLLAPGLLGTCSENRTYSDEAGLRGIRARYSNLRTGNGSWLRARARFLRRHGPPYWPLLVPLPLISTPFRRRSKIVQGTDTKRR